jgi:hypothetical protein
MKGNHVTSMEVDLILFRRIGLNQEEEEEEEEE